MPTHANMFIIKSYQKCQIVYSEKRFAFYSPFPALAKLNSL